MKHGSNRRMDRCHDQRDRGKLVVALSAVVALTLAGGARGDGGVVFDDVAASGSNGLLYARAPSASDAVWQQFTSGPVLTFFDLPIIPTKWRGAPGVAILDADRDGDLDLYVTNGPGRANSLFSNQLGQGGGLTFVDTATTAGVDAFDHDSSGVCFGDTDNDGDPDLLVLSNFGPNRFFVNHGDGIFADASVSSGLGIDARSAMSCSFGDVDGDGLLDVVIGNAFEDMSNSLGIVTPFEFNQHDQLYRNLGDNEFVDVSASSGIEAMTTYGPAFPDAASLTWALAMVDLDLDGDLDIVRATDQAGVPRAVFGGIDRGFLFVHENDGHGRFTDVTTALGLDRVGEWMGLAFADFDHDGNLDLFATNVGDWAITNITALDPVYGDFLVYDLGDSTSRWFLGRRDAGGALSFEDPGVGPLVATPFGWGASATDYDNDGDTDLIYHGGMSIGPVSHMDNDGVLLANNGRATFSYDLDALADSTEHERRVAQGVATGDLDDDGFPDLVSVSSDDLAPGVPLARYGVQWGSPLDGMTGYQQLWLPSPTPGVWVPSGQPDNIDGTLAVERNSGDNGHAWIKVRTRGSVGTLGHGRVNRDGIGAVVAVTPRGGETSLRPVIGGASYASQDSLEGSFGLGDARWATVEVLWPGGVRNRLDRVRRGSRVTFPEIPCTFDDPSQGFGDYLHCLIPALVDLENAGVLRRHQTLRFFVSAIRAYHHAH